MVEIRFHFNGWPDLCPFSTKGTAMKEGMELRIEMDREQLKRIKQELSKIFLDSYHILDADADYTVLAHQVTEQFSIFNQQDDAPNTSFTENALLLNFLTRINAAMPTLHVCGECGSMIGNV